MKVLQLEEVRKSYPTGHIIQKKIEALKGISFYVEKGETFGLLGHNGAGKTTTFKIITSLITPDSGKVEILGGNPTDLNVKKRIGFLPENPYFYTYLTPMELLMFYAGLFEIPAREAKDRARELLKLVKMEKWSDVPIRKFSKGMVQRIGMAQALINNPDLLILDEPMTGLDPVGRKELKDIILAIKEQGKTIIFSSHILSDVEMICDRVVILIRGRVEREGNIRELLTEKATGYEIEIPFKYINWVKETNLPFHTGGGSIFIEFDNRKDANTFLRKAVTDNIEIISFLPRRVQLEDLFMEEYKKYEEDNSGNN